MLKITVDYIPFGIASLRKTIYDIEIVNTGKGTPENGKYRVDIKNEEGKEKRIDIKDFDRLQDYGALKLLEEIIRKYTKGK